MTSILKLFTIGSAAFSVFSVHLSGRIRYFLFISARWEVSLTLMTRQLPKPSMLFIDGIKSGTDPGALREWEAERLVWVEGN